MQIANSPEHAMQLLDNAFNEGDIDTILAIYDEAALVVPQPGVEVQGKEAIREIYKQMLQPGMSVHPHKTRVLEADGIALLISQWSLSQSGQAERTFTATVVLRQQKDGGWKALIDNAQGPAILEA